MSEYLKDAFSKSNLRRAWKWTLSNTEYAYKNYFRDLYQAYSIAIDDNIDDLNKRLISGTYEPSKPVKVYLPKPSGILRPFTLLSVEDQIVYQALVNIVAEFHVKKVKRRYNNTVFGHLYAGKSSNFFYQKWDNSYKQFNKSIKISYKQGYEYIASFDLTACYDSIDYKVLEYLLLQYSIGKDFIMRLQEYLSKWTNENDIYHGHGIPQGPLASGLLSEVILSYFDSMYEQHDCSSTIHYYRYVDDIRLLSKDESSLKMMLVNLDRYSKNIGLFPQSSKIEIHKISDIQTEIKDISSPLLITTPGSIEPDVTLIEKELLKLSPRNEILNITKFKRYLSSAKPSSRLTEKLFKLLDEYPSLTDSITMYLRSFTRKIPDKAVKYILQFIEKLEIYQSINGKLIDSVVNNISEENALMFLEFAECRWRNAKKMELYDTLYKAMIVSIILRYRKLKYNEILDILRKEDNWWVLKTLLHFIDLEYMGEPSYKSIMMEMLRSKQVDVSIIAAYELVNINCKIETPYMDTNHIAQKLLKAGGIITKARKTPSSVGNYVSKICLAEIPKFNWKSMFAAHHDEIENRLIKAYGYSQSDMSAFINIFDVINDFILDCLYKHDPSIGGYNLGSIGSVLNYGGRLQNKYPEVWILCHTVHEKRLECYLSHPIKRATRCYTRPVPYKFIHTIRPLVQNAFIELINKW